MKRIILLILAAFIVGSACSCSPLTTSRNDEAALKISEFSDSLNNKMQEAFGTLPSVSGKASVCKAEGQDLIIIYEHDSSIIMTSEECEEHALGDDIIHYPIITEASI